MGGEGLRWADGERMAAEQTGCTEPEPAPLPGPSGVVVLGCAMWGSRLAAQGSPVAPALGLGPRES